MSNNTKENTMHNGQFILICDEVRLMRRIFNDPYAAKSEAQRVARLNRGVRVHVAVIADTVSEPLPDLVWESGEPCVPTTTGDGLVEAAQQSRQQPQGLGEKRMI